MNYCCGLSSTALRPFLLGTALGSLPGTIAIVLLGDALTGSTPPALLACYGAFALIGALGLVRVVRKHIPAAEGAAAHADPNTAPATLVGVRDPDVRAESGLERG
jgi:uncharacterized membrane protein YdjX (TVP38/TMEM64 family)